MSIIGEFIGADDIDRQEHLNTLFLSLFEHLARTLDPLFFHKRGACREALRFQEREAHTAADDELVAFIDERIDHFHLIGDLRTTQNGDEGTLGIIEHRSERIDLFCHERTRVSRQELRNTRRGSMGAMRSSEGIVDIEISKRSKLTGEFRVVLLLALIETQVLEQCHIAIFERRDRFFS